MVHEHRIPHSLVLAALTLGVILVGCQGSPPDAEQEMLLEKLGLTLPPQPPPRIRACQLTEPTDDGAPPAVAPAVL